LELLRGAFGVSPGGQLPDLPGLGLQPGADGLVPEAASFVLAVPLDLRLDVGHGDGL
jgi:hypothetical protein